MNTNKKAPIKGPGTRMKLRLSIEGCVAYAKILSSLMWRGFREAAHIIMVAIALGVVLLVALSLTGGFMFLLNVILTHKGVIK